MISTEFAEKLYARIEEHAGSDLTHEELETLATIMSSDVMLKALGKAIMYCRQAQAEMSLLNMAEPNAVIEFTRGQGQIQGISKMIAGLLDLVTEKDEEDDDNS